MGGESKEQSGFRDTEGTPRLGTVRGSAWVGLCLCRGREEAGGSWLELPAGYVLGPWPGWPRPPTPSGTDCWTRFGQGDCSKLHASSGF